MLLNFLRMSIPRGRLKYRVARAIFQEVVDVAVVLNALRMAIPPTRLTDF